MGYEAIKFKEFEFWYYRFSRGEFDLDYDVGSIISNLELSNLHNDAIEKIIEKCDLKEQLTLRKVSKDLRSLVDKQKIAYKSIHIHLMDSHIFCVYNDKKVVYASENWDENKQHGGFDNKKSFTIRGEDYVEIALNDLSIALNNPKLRLDKLIVSYYYNDRMRLFRLNSLLQHLNHQIHVKELSVQANVPEDIHKNLLSILPCLKPKELVNIGVFVEDPDDWVPEQALKCVKEIANLEQWKQAEELTLDLFNLFPLEFVMNFKRFDIFTSGLDEDFLMNLRDLFSMSTNFQSCTVGTYGILSSCTEYLESVCERMKSGDPSVVLYHCKIPENSSKIFEFKVDYNEYQIDIEKKNF
ncbi:hypothetical protein GCK72_021028 [Caenorhabditis remanei]|uniref:F-box domain-containing protein n=1 Tax=Caenorhabditis remanei TaxID=31234 RepID=A0A6A5GIR8_CAERE|nr:hypothetical protein GCK72_021028 [Caenorhabditis remanei]KAF1754465.1 hypothetical protein GCK72_021028 [Caenorhabditis remanei]